MKRLGPILFFIVALVFQSTYCWAAPEITAHVTPSSGTLDDVFKLSLRVTGGQPDLAPEFPDSSDFEVGSRGTNSQIQIINGNLTVQVEYVYSLRPLKTGLLNVPRAHVTVRGESLDAPEQQVLVQAGSGGKEADQARTTRLGDPILFRQSVDKLSVYRGEQLVNSIELLYRTQVRDVSLDDVSFDGFWQETLSENENFRTTESGTEYQGLRIQRAIYPLKSGTLKLPARVLKASVALGKQRSPFDFDFDPFDPNSVGSLFGPTMVPRQYRSNELQLDIKELPAAPTDLPLWNNLNPIVGKTDVKVNDVPTEINVGQSVTLEYEVRSLGALQALKDLKIPEGASYKVYQDAPESKNFESGGQLISRKRFKVSIVATRAGTISLPEVAVGYFEPEDGTYHKAKSKPLSLTVRGKLGEPDQVEAQASQTPTQSVAETTPSPETSASASPTPQLLYQEPGLLERLSRQISLALALLVLTGVLVAGGVGLLLWRTLSTANPLKVLEYNLQQSASVEELALNFKSWLAYKLTDPATDSSSSFDALRQVLHKRVKSSDALGAFLVFIDNLQAALYAPQKTTSLAELQEQAKRLINLRWW